MPMETSIQASLSLAESYQQRLWPIASKYLNSPEEEGIYSDPSYASLNPACFHWMTSVRQRGEEYS